MKRFPIELRRALTPIVYADRSIRGLGVVAGKFYDVRPSMVRGGVTISVNGDRFSGTIRPDHYFVPVNEAAVEMLRFVSGGVPVRYPSPLTIINCGA